MRDLHYLVHGLVLASPVELPLRAVPARAADVEYRLSPGDELSGAPRHRRVDDADDPWAVEHWIGDRLVVEFPSRAAFEVSRGSVTLITDEAGDSDLLVHLLLHHVLPRVIALRGDLMLHAAGAVGPSGRAHLLLGATGSGKSTVVARLVVDGWELLDDDGMRIAEIDGLAVVMPGAPTFSLLPASAEAVFPRTRPGPPIASGSAKRQFDVDDDRLRVASVPAPVGGIYVLERTDVKAPRAESLALPAAVSTLVEHGFHLAVEPAAIARQAFERAAALAAATVVQRLLQPAGLDRLDETIELLARLDETLA